jgi:hypothetical protein
MRYAALAIPGFLVVFGGPAVLNDETCVALVAGQPVPMAAATTVGEICLETHEGNVMVRFRAAQGWSFTETQLAVASTLEGVPRAEAGIPIIGRFPRRTAHNPVVEEFTYSIPLAELGVSPGEEVIVAAHAGVVNTTGVEEGGWGRGERFTPRGNPAMYFRYSVPGGVRRS